MASRTFMSGVTVTGSMTMPNSWRLTRATSFGLVIGRQILVDDPYPAFLRHGDGLRASVTVSMAADTSGMFRVMLRVRRVVSEVSRGNTSE